MTPPLSLPSCSSRFSAAPFMLSGKERAPATLLVPLCSKTCLRKFLALQR